MKIIIFRSIAGFGDRLQMLASIFEYCKVNNAKLCVDWFDYTWGGWVHDFDDFFYIEGIETISKKEVLEYIRKKKNKLAIVPSVWDYDSLKTTIETRHTDSIYDFRNNTDFQSFKLPEGDIFVCTGVIETDYKPINITNHLRIKPNVLKIIKDKLKDFDFNSTVIHLRGTDNLMVNENTIVEQFKDYNEPIYAISDDVFVINRIREVLPNIKLVNPNANILKIKTYEIRNDKIIGIHSIEPEVLKYKYNIRKYDLIIELLVDWVVLIYASKIYGNTKSCFFKSAYYIKHGPKEEVTKLFNGWSPTK